MPYRICKIIEVESGHMLSKHPDYCRFPHGHTRKVEIVLEAAELDAAGMVCDFKVVREAAGEFLETFDHAMCVNTEDPMYQTLKAAYGSRVIGFECMEPTTEVIARTFFEEIERRLSEYARRSDVRYPLRPGVRLVRVRVWETSSSWAEYEAPAQAG
ncbi:MAG: 6-carboxytetrahydropterin synthase [Terrimicrobiaceae bacterium]|nr:6-carboxytetrahydropterin synthase [Terrimicrobiaceae bacterium]